VRTTECLSDVLTPFDIVVVPGSPVVGPSLEHAALVNWLGGAGRSARKLASVSNGAFLLARAGLADRRRVTTHSRDAQRLASENPLVHVVTHKGYLKDRNLYSSSGVDAGIHLALSLVKEDLGDEIVGSIAKALLTRRLGR
jgi:transcriptional regulator GlxA family with amidase domain